METKKMGTHILESAFFCLYDCDTNIFDQSIQILFRILFLLVQFCVSQIVMRTFQTSLLAVLHKFRASATNAPTFQASVVISPKHTSWSH